ncbi:TPA: SNF2 helicase associated domain-containing protein [Enterococcus faecalis]
MKWSIPERIVEQGREYMQEGRVLSIVQNPEKRIWLSEVLGEELYLVELDGTAKEQDVCECQYWMEHGYCKHTVAVELALKQRGVSRIIQANQTVSFEKTNRSTAEMFTKGFAKLSKASAEVPLQPLRLEFHLDVIETNNYYPELSTIGLSLKIGLEGTKPKTYIVKNIGDFLQAYEKEMTFMVNKQHQFTLLHDSFSMEIQEILTELAAIYHTSQLLGANGIQVKGKIDKRYLLLPIDRSQSLVEKMNRTGQFILTNQTHKYRYLTFKETSLPLTFTVQKTEEQSFKLTIHNPITTFLAHYHWAIADQTVYLLTEEQEAIYTTLLQLMKRLEEPSIIYEKETVSDLFSEVLPLLEKIGRVSVEESVEELVVHHPLKAVFIFKKIKGRINARIDYHYGEVIFSTNPKYAQLPEVNQEIVRDKAKETAIKQQFQQFAYQQTTTGFEKVLPAGESLYYFFKAEVPAFRQLGEVRMGRKLRELYLDAQHHQPTIEVAEGDSWLDIRFDVTGIDETEIDAVLTSLLRNDAFYTLKSGEILAFDSEEFFHTSAILTKLRKNMHQEDNVIHVPKNQGLMIESLLEDNERAHFSDSFKKMVTDLTHPENFEAQVPKTLQATLRHYQETGYKWLKMLSHYQFGGILADEMGLGKTLQTITYLLSEKEEERLKGTALIVAPASLTYNWLAEVKRFAPTLNVQVVSGNRQERAALLQNSTEDILITSYASMRQDVQLYQEMRVGYLILDEAQMVKNSGTKTAQALKSLKVPQRFALSGTPIENNLDELWSIFQMILPGLFPGKKAFREIKPEEIAKMIQPFILRRDKKTVLADLPEKIENNMYSVLTEEQKTVYLAYLKQMQADVSQMDQATFKKNRMSILAGLTRLRQICCDPRLFIEDYTGGSGKVEQVKDFLVAAKENNRRVLLFSQFTSMLSILEKELNELGLETFYLRGSTKPQDRLTMANAFNEGEKDVFLISLKAGGTGLNLTGADTVILYDLWWNPAVEEQAAGRAHRMGQKKVVEVWRMIAEGTVEEKMNSLQQEKRELFQKVIQGNEEQLAKMTEEDIRTILSIGE